MISTPLSSQFRFLLERNDFETCQHSSRQHYLEPAIMNVDLGSQLAIEIHSIVWISGALIYYISGCASLF